MSSPASGFIAAISGLVGAAQSITLDVQLDGQDLTATRKAQGIKSTPYSNSSGKPGAWC